MLCGTRLDPDSFLARQYDRCDECIEKPPAFAQVIAYGEYSGELRELIHLVKYSGVVSAVPWLARKMAQALEPARRQLPQPLVLTAVPLFAAKQQQRGFNQARLLATELGRVLRKSGWNVSEDFGLLSRTRATRSQSELNLTQRRANLRGVFSPGENAAAIAGANLLLVDDIVTTATTVRQCSAVLKRKKAAGIWVVAAARSQRNDIASWNSPDIAGGVQ